jgi:hypothetical protein
MNTRPIIWQATDNLWFIARDFYGQSGFRDVADFVFAIQAVNARIYDWLTVPAGTLIQIPYGA